MWAPTFQVDHVPMCLLSFFDAVVCGFLLLASVLNHQVELPSHAIVVHFLIHYGIFRSQARRLRTRQETLRTLGSEISTSARGAWNGF